MSEDRTVLSRYWPGPVAPRQQSSLLERLRRQHFSSGAGLIIEAIDAIQRMEKQIAYLDMQLEEVRRSHDELRHERDVLAEQVMP